MKTFIKLFFVFLFIFLAIPTLASEVRLEGKLDVFVEENFLVNLVINTDNSVNAIEGKILYPHSILEVKEIRDGSSILNFWLERPELSSPGEIFFSGITPLGFSGNNNIVFSILFEAKSEGVADVSLDDFKVLLNDGEGTSDDLSFSDINISVNKGELQSKEDIIVDKDLPEDFLPILATDPDLFGGKYFIVFATQDKISGIDRYEIREGRNEEFQENESPYLIKGQSLNKKLFIKAYDKAGNSRLVVFNPKQGQFEYKNIVFFVIILVLLFIFLLKKKLWRKFLKK